MKRALFWAAVFFAAASVQAEEWESLGPDYSDEQEIEDALIRGDLSQAEADRLDAEAGFEKETPLRGGSDAVKGEIRQEYRSRSGEGPIRTRARISALDGRLLLGGLWAPDRTGVVRAPSSSSALPSRAGGIRWQKRSAVWQNRPGRALGVEAALGNFRLPLFDESDSESAPAFLPDLKSSRSLFSVRRPWAMNGEGVRISVRHWNSGAFHSLDRYAAKAGSVQTEDGIVEGEAQGGWSSWQGEGSRTGLFWVRSRSSSASPVEGLHPFRDSPGFFLGHAWPAASGGVLFSRTLSGDPQDFLSGWIQGGDDSRSWGLEYRRQDRGYKNPAGRRFDGLFPEEFSARALFDVSSGSGGFEYRRRIRAVGPFLLPSQRFEGRLRVRGGEGWSFLYGSAYEDLKSVRWSPSSGLGSRRDEWRNRWEVSHLSSSGVGASLGAEWRRSETQPSAKTTDAGRISGSLSWRPGPRSQLKGEFRQEDSDWSRPDTETQTLRLGAVFRLRSRWLLRADHVRKIRARSRTVVSEGVEADEEVSLVDETWILGAQVRW